MNPTDLQQENTAFQSLCQLLTHKKLNKSHDPLVFEVINTLTKKDEAQRLSVLLSLGLPIDYSVQYDLEDSESIVQNIIPQYAFLNQALKCLETLADKQVDFTNFRLRGKHNPIYLALQQENKGLLDFLIKNGAPIYEGETDGGNFLHSATQRPAMFDYLMQLPLPKELLYAEFNGETPLTMALSEWNMVEQLIHFDKSLAHYQTLQKQLLDNPILSQEENYSKALGTLDILIEKEELSRNLSIGTQSKTLSANQTATHSDISLDTEYPKRIHKI